MIIARLPARAGALLLTAALTACGAAASPAPAAGPAPWMATLALRGPQPLPQRASCGGALVAPDRILTAAHCLDGVPPETLRDGVEYHVGATTLSRDPGRTARIAAVAVDPGYRILPSPAAPDEEEASSATHDLAVVTLDGPVAGIEPLPLAAGAPVDGEAVTLYGHGITGPASGTSDALKAIPFRIAPVAGCAPETPAPVDPASMICGRGDPGVACFGDSGGPLVRRGPDGRAELVGVFSFGMETAKKPCGTPGPDFFTGRAGSRAWLDAQLTGR